MDTSASSIRSRNGRSDSASDTAPSARSDGASRAKKGPTPADAPEAHASDQSASNRADDAGAASAAAATDWAGDPDTLRDEGVLFGLTGDGTGVDDKKACIRRHFDRRAAAAERERAGVKAALEQLQSRRARVKDRIARLRQQIDDPDEPEIQGGSAPDVASHYFLRYIVGFVLALGLCTLNYFLIYELIAPAFAQANLIAAGVLMAGMFALFQPSSLLYGNDADQGMLQDAPAELWKQRISEFGMPLAAALFTVVWRAAELGWIKAAAAFLFVFMLFLFGGKLLLSIIPKLSLVTRNMMRNRRIRARRTAARDRIRTLRDERMAALDREEQALRERLHAIPTTSEFDAARDSALSLFTSEYRLAREARAGRHISPSQIDAVVRA
jgi:cell division protein FtsB